MSMKIYTINQNGINQIKDFLMVAHKQKFFSEKMLQAWAADAEFQLGQGNGACIEIPSFFSASGHTKKFTVSGVGIDSQDIDDE
jgi:hypothetical protein